MRMSEEHKSMQRGNGKYLKKEKEDERGISLSGERNRSEI
jgi:hypothetical protein